jgi:hypothetical protein
VSSFERIQHAFWIVLILGACGSVGQEGGAVAPGPGDGGEGVSSYLTPESRALVRPLGGDAEGRKLIEIEIAEVVNPQRIRVSLEVHHRIGQDEVLLGTFGLYPPDDPGTFLISAKAPLPAEGSLVLTLQVLDEVSPEDRLRIGVGRISFRKE